MSAFKTYKTAYIAATAAALGAAFLIGRPWAFYIPSLMGTMISDPDGMTESAQNWSTSELTALKKDLEDVKTYLEDNGTWEGDAFKAFESVHASFLESIEALDEARNNTGEAVGSTAAYYKGGAILCLGVAALMWEFAGWKNVIRLILPGGPAAAEAADAAVGAAVTTTMRSSLTKHGFVIAALVGLLGLLKSQMQTAGKALPMLEAIPTQATTAVNSGDYTMPFMNDGLEYNEGTGLTPKMDKTMTPRGGAFPI